MSCAFLSIESPFQSDEGQADEARIDVSDSSGKFGFRS